MKKILLPLFLIATAVGTVRLSAYCVYNWSSKERIIIQIYSGIAGFELASDFNRRANYVLSPGGGKACWNWKDIDKNNRKKEWYWVAYDPGRKTINKRAGIVGKGYFPIGGTITFAGYDSNYKAKFRINYGGKTWRYWESPWNHKSQPWKTFKR